MILAPVWELWGLRALDEFACKLFSLRRCGQKPLPQCANDLLLQCWQKKYENRICFDLASSRAQAIRAVRALTEKVLSSSQSKRQSASSQTNSSSPSTFPACSLFSHLPWGCSNNFTSFHTLLASDPNSASISSSSTLPGGRSASTAAATAFASLDSTHDQKSIKSSPNSKLSDQEVTCLPCQDHQGCGLPVIEGCIGQATVEDGKGSWQCVSL